jgi:hypothetical protein
LNPIIRPYEPAALNAAVRTTRSVPSSTIGHPTLFAQDGAQAGVVSAAALVHENSPAGLRIFSNLGPVGLGVAVLAPHTPSPLESMMSLGQTTGATFLLPEGEHNPEVEGDCLQEPPTPFSLRDPLFWQTVRELKADEVEADNASPYLRPNSMLRNWMQGLLQRLQVQAALAALKNAEANNPALLRVPPCGHRSCRAMGAFDLCSHTYEFVGVTVVALQPGRPANNHAPRRPLNNWVGTAWQQLDYNFLGKCACFA